MNIKFNKKYFIIALIPLLVLVLIYFIFFKKDNIIILYIEGIDIRELDKYTYEQLPNLKELYFKEINTDIPLNNPSSFASILSGKYIYYPWFEKKNDEYCINNEADFSNLFNNIELSQYADDNHFSVKFINGFNWDLEKIIHQTNDFNVKDIIIEAKDNFTNAKNELISYLEEKQDDLVVFGVNYPAIILQVSEDESGIFESYKSIDNLIDKIQNLMKKRTVLFVISPFGFSNVSKSVDINNALVYRGFLKGFNNAAQGYFLNDCDLKESFSYSPRAGEIFVNQKAREKFGKVDNDFKAVIEDTAYVLSFIDYEEDKLIDTQLYNTDEYLHQKDIGELFIAMPEGYNIFWPEQSCFINKDIIVDSKLVKDHLNIKPDLIPGIILLNKEIVEDLVEDLDRSGEDQSGEVQDLSYLNIFDLIKNLIN